MSYEIGASTNDCYPGTTCLVNKFDIRDESKLQEMEAAITFAKAGLLAEKPISEAFDFEHYKAIHRFLFEDIFEWAGTVRSVNLSNRGTFFVPAEEIEELGERIFNQIREENLFKSYPRKKFVQRIVQFNNDTNMLHPFREGNGRCQRAFLTQLVRHSGHDIDFASVDADELIISTIQAAHGVMDNLNVLFEKMIRW